MKSVLHFVQQIEAVKLLLVSKKWFRSSVYSVRVLAYIILSGYFSGKMLWDCWSWVLTGSLYPVRCDQSAWLQGGAKPVEVNLVLIHTASAAASGQQNQDRGSLSAGVCRGSHSHSPIVAVNFTQSQSGHQTGEDLTGATSLEAVIQLISAFHHYCTGGAVELPVCSLRTRLGGLHFSLSLPADSPLPGPHRDLDHTRKH